MAAGSNRKAQDIDSEIQKYRKAVEDNPSSRFYAPLADALRRKGELKEAGQVAMEGLRIHPRYLSGIVVAAQVCKDSSDFTRALELFNQASRMNPENIAAQKGLAEIYDILGDHARAMQAYSSLVILDPADKKAKQRLLLLEATAPPKTPAPAKPAPPPETPPEKPAADPVMEKPPEQAFADKAETPPPLPDPAEVGVLEQPQTAAPLAGPGEIPPAPEAAAPGEAPPPPPEEPAAPDQEQVDTQPGREPEPETEVEVKSLAEAPPRKKFTEEEKLDRFFDGFGKNAGEEESGFLVKDAATALPEDEKTEDTLEFAISSSEQGRNFWRKGHHNRALMAMAHELWADSQNAKLREEFTELCRAMSRDPEAVLDEARDVEEGLKANSDSPLVLPPESLEGPQQEPEEEMSAGMDDEPAAGMEPQKQRVRALRSYLGKIRKKESAP